MMMTGEPKSDFVILDEQTIEEPLFVETSYKGKPEFHASEALAVLLAHEVVFLNSHWWEKEWPQQARDAISVNVVCNDIFAWACSDAEELSYKEIEELYRMWKKDSVWGAAAFCIKKRKMMPQVPVEKRIRTAGIWNLEELTAVESST